MGPSSGKGALIALTASLPVSLAGLAMGPIPGWSLAAVGFLGLILFAPMARAPAAAAEASLFSAIMVGILGSPDEVAIGIGMFAAPLAASVYFVLDSSVRARTLGLAGGALVLLSFGYRGLASIGMITASPMGDAVLLGPLFAGTIALAAALLLGILASSGGGDPEKVETQSATKSTDRNA